MIDIKKCSGECKDGMECSAFGRSDADADRQGGQSDIILITLHLLLSAVAHDANVVILCSVSGT